MKKKLNLHRETLCFMETSDLKKVNGVDEVPPANNPGTANGCPITTSKQ